MAIQTDEYSAKLSPETIRECYRRIREYLGGLELPKKDVLRHAMTVEEILMNADEVLTEKPTVRLRTGRRFMRNAIVLEIEGAPCNFVNASENELGVLGGGLLKTIGLSPDYTYTNGCNRYTLTIKKKSSNPLFSLGIAAIAAVLIGFLGFLLSEQSRALLLNEMLIPLDGAFLDLMGGIAGPMVFLSVTWGIYGIGDASTLKSIGKKLCGSYVGSLAIISSALCLLSLPLFSLRFAGGEGIGSSLISIFGMLLGLIPKDIFSPFVNGNTLQIIFLAVIVGIAMLYLGQKTDLVTKLVEQINHIVQFLIEAICKLVPAFIFVVLLKLIWSDMIRSLASIGKLITVFIAAVLLAVAALVGYTAMRNKVSPFLLIKKGLPTLLIAFSTASSAAAFSSNMDISRKKYGIDEKLCSFGIPLGVVTFKMSTALSYMLQCLFFAELYAVDVSFSWIVIMLLTSVILSVATPPIPGGGLATYAVLFSQLGIPSEALAVALACDTVFDFVITGIDQFCIPLVLLNAAGKLGFTDRDVLLKK